MAHVPVVSQNDIHRSVLRAGLSVKQMNEVQPLINAYTTKDKPDSPRGHINPRELVELIDSLRTHTPPHMTPEDVERVKRELETHLK